MTFCHNNPCKWQPKRESGRGGGGGGGKINIKMEMIETNVVPKEDIGSCIVCNGSIGIDTEIVLLFTSYVEFA